MPIKIMLVNDYTLFRPGIKSLLISNDKYDIVSEAADSFECLSSLDDLDVDIIILNFNLSSNNCFELLSSIKKDYSNIKVILIKNNNSHDDLIRAYDTSVDGYLTEDSDYDELIHCINTVYSGQKYIQDGLNSIINEIEKNISMDQELVSQLTKREIEILKQIAGGRFNKEIADSLDITERTVKTHISNLFKKINVNDRTQAAVFAIRNNMVNLY